MSRTVCGINPVREAIKANPEKIERLYYIDKAKRGRAGDLLRLAGRIGIKISKATRHEMDCLSGGVKHQGLAARLSCYDYSALSDIISKWRACGERAFILVLDGIQDPHNLGAILRSAEGAGVHGVIIPKDRAASVTAVVEKVSAGAAGHLMIAKVTNIAKTVDELKSEGVWIIGAEGGSDRTFLESDFRDDVAIVIGGEGKGLRSLVRKKCDYIVSIPMFGKTDSLNASVSAAVILYEVVRQRLRS